MEPHQETGHPMPPRQSRSLDEDNRYVKVLPTSFHCQVCHVSHCHDCHVNDFPMPVSGAMGRTAESKEEKDLRNEVQELTRNLESCTEERDDYKGQLDALVVESEEFRQRIQVFMMNIKDLKIIENTNIIIGDGNTMRVNTDNLPEVLTKLMELKNELGTANHARNGVRRMTATLDESMWKQAAVRFGVNKEIIPATETDLAKRTRTIYAHLLYQWVCREPDKTEEDLTVIIEDLQLEKKKETRKRLEAMKTAPIVIQPAPPRDTKRLQAVDNKLGLMVPMVQQILERMDRFDEERSLLPMIEEVNERSKKLDEERSLLKMEELIVHEQTKTLDEEEIDAGDVAEEGLNKDTTPTTLSTPSHRIKISLVRGKMAEQKVDVMVNSTGPNTELLGRGQLSKSLAKAGGDSLKMHCTKRFPEGISVGSMGVTPGGDLKCQILIHVCLTRWEEDEHISKQLMAKLIDDCLAEAETRGYTSIAFPALGTGYLEYPPKVVAELMFDRIQVFEIDNPLSTVHDVSLVIFPSNTNVIAAFEDESQNRR